MTALRQLISRFHLGHHRDLPSPENADKDRTERRVAERRGNVIVLPGNQGQVGQSRRNLQAHQRELEIRTLELRQAREQNQATIEQLTQFYDRVPVGLLSLAQDGSIRRVNLACATLLSEEAGRLVNRPFDQFIQEEYRPAFKVFLAEAFASRDLASAVALSCELALSGPDRQESPAFVRLEANPGREDRGCEFVVVDLTNAKLASDALLRSNVELQQFGYMAAHDLKAPLRAINGLARMLQDGQGSRPDPLLMGRLQQIIGQTERMRALIEDLLSYSGLESPARSLEVVDFCQVFDEIVALLEPDMVATGGSISRGALPAVVGCRTQLTQLMQNLLENGLKYRGDTPAQVHVSAWHAAGEWTFAVRDNGIGIADIHHKAIFELFHRLHSQQVYPGTGVGLAICRRVVQQHGGRIWVESQPGQGSVFYFALPDRQGDRSGGLLPG